MNLGGKFRKTLIGSPMQRIRRRLPPYGQALLRGRELVQALLGRRKGALDEALEMQPGTVMCGLPGGTPGATRATLAL